MNCHDLQDCLSRGQPVTGELAEHVEGCGGCRAMLAALSQRHSVPNREVLEGVRRSIAATSVAVRPLPSDGAMISMALVFFVVFSLIATVPFGFDALHELTWAQKSIYYGGISACAISFALVTVEQMVPGSRRRLSAAFVSGASLLLIAGLAVFLFPNFDLSDFVSEGIPCLRLGTACAAISGGLGYLLLRKGFFITAVKAGATAGFFAGLAGIAVLALHCPIENAAHILVWHLGAMLTAGTLGAIAGYAGSRLSTKHLAH